MKVYQAINAVQKGLAKEGITKDKRNAQQGYNFRGIDDVYNALCSLLSDNGLVVIPRTMARETIERQTKNGGALFYVTVDMEFDFVAAEDGSKHTARTFGEAMDSADKATNKAMSAAYKYAMFQTFCIPTEAQDADATTHDIAPAKTAAELEVEVQALRAKQAHDAALAEHRESVDFIRDRIAANDLQAAADEWRDLGEQVQRALWLATTKGGIFTTDERKTIKEKLPRATERAA